MPCITPGDRGGRLVVGGVDSIKSSSQKKEKKGRVVGTSFKDYPTRKDIAKKFVKEKNSPKITKATWETW